MISWDRGTTTRGVDVLALRSLAAEDRARGGRARGPGDAGRLFPHEAGAEHTGLSSVNPAAPFTIVALGDSYMSGEGAATFFEGTDIPGTNSCRRAPSAYPVRVAAMLETSTKPRGVDLVFVACSGAETINIGDEFTLPGVKAQRQYPRSGEPVQIEALRSHPGADVVLISVGGNDARFSDVVTLCAGRRKSCIPLAQEWLENLDGYLQPQLRALFRQVLDLVKPEALVYVLTYPELFDAGECPDVGMDPSEVAFLTETFIPRLNEQITFAAMMEGVDTISLADVFRGQGLCARGPDRHGGAINGFRWQRTGRLVNRPSEWLRGSMHPTEFGHALVARKVVEQIRADLLSPTNAPRPFDHSLPPGWDAGDAPPGPPPFGASEFGVPLGPWELQPNPCSSVAQRRGIRRPRADP